jgi:hypothetical protein
MNKLSLAAQAVLWAGLNRDSDRLVIAAALRAAADQVVPEVLLLGSDYQEIALQEARKAILAIAEELEADA